MDVKYRYDKEFLLALRQSPLVKTALSSDALESIKIATLEAIVTFEKQQSEKIGRHYSDSPDKQQSQRSHGAYSKQKDSRRRPPFEDGRMAASGEFNRRQRRYGEGDNADGDADGLAKFRNMSARDLQPTLRTSLTAPIIVKKNGERYYKNMQQVFGDRSASDRSGPPSSDRWPDESIPQLDPEILVEFKDLLEPFDDLQKFKIGLKYQELRKSNPNVRMEDLLPKGAADDHHRRTHEVFNLKKEAEAPKVSKFARFFSDKDSAEEPHTDTGSSGSALDVNDIERGLKSILLKSSSSLSLEGSESSVSEAVPTAREAQPYVHPALQTRQQHTSTSKASRSLKSKNSTGNMLAQMLQSSIQGKRGLHSASKENSDASIRAPAKAEPAGNAQTMFPTLGNMAPYMPMMHNPGFVGSAHPDASGLGPGPLPPSAGAPQHPPPPEMLSYFLQLFNGNLAAAIAAASQQQQQLAALPPFSMLPPHMRPPSNPMAPPMPPSYSAAPHGSLSDDRNVDSL